MRLNINNVFFSYGSVPALENITFEVRRGETLGIVGPNGSGKSTILRCLAGVLKPRTGVISFDGRSIMTFRGMERGKLLGYVPPPGAGLTFSFTVLETVLQGRRPHLSWGVGQRDLEVVNWSLDYLNLKDLKERQLGELSSGQQQKVFIARALAQEPEVFLLDEPTATLDIRYQLEVLTLVSDLARERGRLVIMVLHDLNMASRFADRLLLFSNGRIYAAGKPREVLTEEHLEAVYGVKTVVTESPWGLQVIAVEPVESPRSLVPAEPALAAEL
ncbi:MAG: ABC transporter ATP-binding protein [Firmicutes bacterium]|nr:ABC transporter ATP-binding protein [Bacillota bacterium]MBV1727888.1 ABC transporter ATP-binding protein [Desulforudis sp.]MBU4533406.1 ABC transporter ATP-binding protein [Bacillota bacterium]MBU4555204.1 ABC transporter ATP-binding protein [Bacillota bacterium]MBV1735703.1 ABC transporter ATP-binding protein [Desulforudis sp.]